MKELSYLNKYVKVIQDNNESFELDFLRIPSLGKFVESIDDTIEKLDKTSRFHLSAQTFIMKLRDFFQEVIDANPYTPLINMECEMNIHVEEDRVDFNINGIGTFFAGDEDDNEEIREENFGLALEPLRSWEKHMAVFTKNHIVDQITDFDYLNEGENGSFKIEVWDSYRI